MIMSIESIRLRNSWWLWRIELSSSISCWRSHRRLLCRSGGLSSVLQDTKEEEAIKVE
jgi:hypothetical protein